MVGLAKNAEMQKRLLEFEAAFWFLELLFEFIGLFDFCSDAQIFRCPLVQMFPYDLKQFSRFERF